MEAEAAEAAEAAAAAAVPEGTNRGEAEDVVATRTFHRLRGADGFPPIEGLSRLTMVEPRGCPVALLTEVQRQP